MEEKLQVRRDYKDTVFRMVYRQKEKLLELYNALNGTGYKEPEELEVYTLENAIYMNMKNDVSILLDSVLTLYEQQSSVNPNLPLRDLMYVSRQLEKYVRDKPVYSSKLIRLPVPKFIIFYNGTRSQPEKQILKLSDAYLKETSEPELELKVTMLNINPGYNGELMEKCQTLREYSAYVARVRRYAGEFPLEEAVRRSVEECIKEGILAEFLQEQKSEVIAMSIFEYNEETELKKIREAEYEIGLEEGRSLGLEEGRRLGQKEGFKEGKRALIETCRELGCTEEEIVQRLTDKFRLSLEEAESLAKDPENRKE